ncbi:MAG: hypothetical protein WCT19_00545 [Candidatus Paceibacterota bacterium]
MRKIKTLFVLGMVILIAPFTGFPGLWKAFFLNVAGILICLISFIMYRTSSRKASSVENSYSESQSKNDSKMVV